MPINDDNTIRDILATSKTIAVVGASVKPYRDSHSIADYLERHGYTVYRVNPRYAEIDGKPCYASLADLPVVPDIVDVFRNADAVPEIMDETIAVKAPTIWLQFDVVHEEAAQKGEAAGVNVIMDRCIAVDHRRLVH